MAVTRSRYSHKRRKAASKIQPDCLAGVTQSRSDTGGGGAKGRGCGRGIQGVGSSLAC